MFERGCARVHRELGVLQSSALRQARLVVDREPLREPGGTVRVGEERWPSAEHALRQAPYPADAIEVEDVGELVRDDDAQPVFVQAERAGFNWWCGEDDDPVGRRWSGIAVGVVGVVGDDEIDGTPRLRQLRRELRIGSFRCGARHAAFPLQSHRDVNVEMPGVEREIAVVRGRLGVEGCRQQHGGEGAQPVKRDKAEGHFTTEDTEDTEEQQWLLNSEVRKG